jgi:hypothetical protein
MARLKYTGILFLIKLEAPVVYVPFSKGVGTEATRFWKLIKHSSDMNLRRMAVMSKIISVEKTLHKNKLRLKLIFDRDEILISGVQTIRDCCWSESLRCWHIPYYDNHPSFLNKKFNGKIRFLPSIETAGKQTSLSQKAESSTKVQVPQVFVERRRYIRMSRGRDLRI